MSKYIRMNAVVRLRRFHLPGYANYMFYFHLAIIWFYDFRGMISYSGSRSLVAFSFPRWLDCPVPTFLNYLLSLPIFLLSFIHPAYARRFYFYNASRYIQDGNMYIWVNNSDLEVVSTQFCRQSAKQHTRQCVRQCVRQYFRQRISLRTKPIFRHRARMIFNTVPLYRQLFI